MSCTRSTPLRGPAPRTRDELREHFRPTGTGPELDGRPVEVVIHETADPEVVIAEFEYRGTVVDTGESSALPGIFVLHVRDGEIVSTAARICGRLDALVDAVRARAAEV
jgi:uncharacterized protein